MIGISVFIPWLFVNLFESAISQMDFPISALIFTFSWVVDLVVKFHQIFLAKMSPGYKPTMTNTASFDVVRKPLGKLRAYILYDHDRLLLVSLVVKRAVHTRMA